MLLYPEGSGSSETSSRQSMPLTASFYSVINLWSLLEIIKCTTNSHQSSTQNGNSFRAFPTSTHNTDDICNTDFQTQLQIAVLYMGHLLNSTAQGFSLLTGLYNHYHESFQDIFVIPEKKNQQTLAITFHSALAVATQSSGNHQCAVYLHRLAFSARFTQMDLYNQ